MRNGRWPRSSEIFSGQELARSSRPAARRWSAKVRVRGRPIGSDRLICSRVRRPSFVVSLARGASRRARSFGGGRLAAGGRMVCGPRSSSVAGPRDTRARRPGRGIRPRISELNEPTSRTRSANRTAQAPAEVWRPAHGSLSSRPARREAAWRARRAVISLRFQNSFIQLPLFNFHLEDVVALAEPGDRRERHGDT